jgi:hypothetical protein
VVCQLLGKARADATASLDAWEITFKAEQQKAKDAQEAAFQEAWDKRREEAGKADTAAAAVPPPPKSW